MSVPKITKVTLLASIANMVVNAEVFLEKSKEKGGVDLTENQQMLSAFNSQLETVASEQEFPPEFVQFVFCILRANPQFSKTAQEKNQLSWEQITEEAEKEFLRIQPEKQA